MLRVMTITNTEGETMTTETQPLTALERKIQSGELAVEDLTPREKQKALDALGERIRRDQVTYETLAPGEKDLILDALTNATCTRCHGSGREPGQLATDAQFDVMIKLYMVGQLRKKFSAARSYAKVTRRMDAWAEIDRLWREADAAGISQAQAANAIGVSRPYFNALISGKVG